MARLLVVDRLAEDRARLAADLTAAGYEVEQAPDGLEAFEHLLALPYDAIVAEAEVERLALPALITKVRPYGVKAPVLALTTATSAAGLPDLLKGGVAAGIDKASSPQVLREKLVALLDPDHGNAATVAAAPDEGPTLSGGVLLIDTGSTEHDRLRPLFPRSVRLDACATVKDALARGRNGAYCLMLLDLDASVLNLAAVIAQLRVLQPEAALVALTKSEKGGDQRAVAKSVEELGFEDVLWKPFQKASVDLLLEHYATTWDDLVATRDDVVSVSNKRCRADQRDRYLNELTTRLAAALQPIAQACYDCAVLDLTRVNHLLLPTDAVALIGEAERLAADAGMKAAVVWSPEMVAAIRGIVENREVEGRLHSSIAAARAHLAGA
jgi:two-component system cell cycle response regulator